MVNNKKLNDFYHGQDTPTNIGELVDFLSDIADRHIHGLRDNDYWKEGELVEEKSGERLEKIRKGAGELITHCRYISQTTLALLEGVGLPGRVIDFIAAERKLSGYRHTVSEIYYDRAWIHVDTDMGILFITPDYLSSFDTAERFQQGEMNSENIQRLVTNKKIDEKTFPDFRKIIENDLRLIEWYENLTAAMMIKMDFYTFNEDIGEKVKYNFVDSKKNKTQCFKREDFLRNHY